MTFTIPLEKSGSSTKFQLSDLAHTKVLAHGCYYTSLFQKCSIWQNLKLLRRGQTHHKELLYGFAVIHLANIQIIGYFRELNTVNNYPRNTKSDQTSRHKNPVNLLSSGQSSPGKRYKLLLSQYYNMVFEK